MPNNHLGSNPNPDIDLPRAPIANDPSFKVLRQLDGHIVADPGVAMTEQDLANPHEVS